MVPGKHRDTRAGRRAWAYRLIDLLVIGSCSLVFVAVVAGAKGQNGRRPAVEEWTRDAGFVPTGLHHSAAHEQRLGGLGPWTPTRPR
jgi:hypothetical protein